ncbi:hypothetical protein KEU06_19550 [Pseudaminobacter sp. 19-2017]|uniref:Uncharacterized protein n=1 Tax=Pseudaminobacter soli (ex Zhang et al. 2022) TaxID=2831468 RepID=A0A942IAS3_9HYPH|nr:hypothetical protein [Pseudaminobacter soli]MBS3650811.1 hypothetical protein [Pseudaminobacter soli]
MAKDYAKIIAKLDRPPAGPNWVRFIGADLPSTTKSILSFAKGIPQFTYQTGYAAIKDRIQLGIELETALGIVRHRGSPAGKVQNEELVRAFYAHDDERGYAARNPIDFERGHFLVSREVQVPVAPLSVIRERGTFLPIFVCGWSTLSLTLMQRRLLVTICEDAFLSLTDYQNGPAEYLFFPKDGEKVRSAETWQRGDYEQLSGGQLADCIEMFLEARDEARRVLMEEWHRERERGEAASTTVHAEMDDLFTPKK